MFDFIKNFGRLPAGYNEKVHGPFDPAVYYGKRDIPFGEVKVGELVSWLSRREKSPVAMTQAVSRAWWRWQFKYCQPKRAGLTPVIHLVLGFVGVFYLINYEHIRFHSWRKYH